MSRKTYFGSVLSATLAIVWLSISGAAEKRRHEAHVHGIAEISIAITGSKVEFRAPAESVIGFEHEAKSESDKKQRDVALRTVQTKMNQMLIFDPKLGCKFSEVKTAVVEDRGEPGNAAPGKEAHEHKNQKKTGEHREVHTNVSLTCDKPLSGSRAMLGVYKTFPAIHETKVQVLGDIQQSGATIKKDKGEVRF
jgi:hypothetical protein